RHTHQPVAMTEIVVREADLLRAEQKRDAVRSKTFADQTRAVFQAAERMVQGPMADGCSAYDQRAIGHGFGDALELFGALEHIGCADSRARLSKRRLIGIHDAQMAESEIAHGAGGRAD